MLKIHTKDIKPTLYRFRVLVLFFIISFFTVIVGGIFIAIIPFVFILFYFIFEKYVLEFKELEEYSFLDLVITSLFHAFSVGVALFLVIFLFIS